MRIVPFRLVSSTGFSLWVFVEVQWRKPTG
jgi:hypothetical protein